MNDLQATDKLDLLYNEKMEQTVIVGVLLQPTLFASLNTILVSDHFWLLRHKQLWGAYQTLHKNGEAIDLAMLRQTMVNAGTWQDFNTEMYLTDAMVKINNHLNITDYAKKIRTLATKRVALQARAKMLDHIMNSDLSTEQMVASMESEVQTVRSGISENHTHTAKQMADYMLDLLNVQEGGRIPTGFSRLDENLGGGLPRGEVTVVGAQSGLGKTWFALNVTKNVLSHKVVGGKRFKVLFISLEMLAERGSQQLNPRLLSIMSGIDEYKIKQAGKYIVGNDHLQKQFTSTIAEFSEFDLVVCDATNMTPAFVRDQALLHQPDLIVCDYLQLMSDDEKHYSRHTEFSSIIKKLKEIAKGVDSKPNILLPAQINRDGVHNTRSSKKPPRKESLKESGDIENHSAQVIMLWDFDEESDPKRIAAIVDKNRYGAEYRGKWYTAPPMFEKHPTTGRFTELPPTQIEHDKG